MQTQRKPLFITFEGGEGSGKSTQAELFYEWFLGFYGPAILTREPGGVEVSEQIRKILLDNKNKGKITCLTELFLFEAARAQLVNEKLKPALGKGKSVICKRFNDSTTAYQGYGGAFNLNQISKLNALACQNHNPDLTFILDIPAEIGLERARQRAKEKGQELSLFDEKPLAYHEKANFGFMQIAEQEPKRCIVIHYKNERSQKGIAQIQWEIREEFIIRYKKL